MEIYFIRHLPTQWNIDGYLQGSRNIPILTPTKRIKKEIIKNKKLLENKNFEKIVTSELIRTQQTAKMYDFFDFTIEPLMNEFNFGEFEGVLKEKMLSKNGQDWSTNVYNLSFGGDIFEFEKRIKSFLIKYEKYSKILVFGHGFVGRAINALVTEGSLKLMNQVVFPNNCIKIFHIEGTHSS